jgi:methionyl-tRNA synthetase
MSGLQRRETEEELWRFMEVPYLLSKYDPGALRFYLTATAPETRDTEFLWKDFVERQGQQRAGGEVGSLRVANRMLSFACKHFDGVVP